MTTFGGHSASAAALAPATRFARATPASHAVAFAGSGHIPRQRKSAWGGASSGGIRGGFRRGFPADDSGPQRLRRCNATPPETSSDQQASLTGTRATAHGSPAWREFLLAATGEWGGCCVAFDLDGIALDVPFRFVHGVGRVPATNMPFRDVVFDWMTKCEITAEGGDGRAAHTGGLTPL